MIQERPALYDIRFCGHLASMYTGTVPVHPVGLAAEVSGQLSECEMNAGVPGTTTAALDLDTTPSLTVTLTPPGDPGVQNQAKGLGS